MKQYPEYKDSGIEWIGEMPSHWDKKKLKYLVKNCIDKSNNNEEFKIALENIESNTGKFIDSNGKEFEVFSGEGKKFKKNDVLFNKLRPYLSKVYLASRDGACVGEFLVLKPFESLNSNFLFWRLLSDEFIKEINSSTYGAKMPRASWEFIGNLELPYPSKNEQKNLASYLDFKTKQIDSLILKKSKLIELLKEQRAAMIDRAVTKGLNPNALMKYSGIEWLGKIPEHWEVKRLKFLASIKYGLGQPPKSSNNGIPFIRATNIERGRINQNDMIYVDPNFIPYERDPILKTNDIIVVRSGAYTADSAIITEKYNGAVAGYDMVVRSNKVNPIFLSYALLSDYVLFGQLYLHRSRAAQPHLNVEELGSTLITFPNDDYEQKLVANCILEDVKKIDEIQYKIEREIELLKEYQTALISEVVTGKIDVRDEK